MKIILVYSVTHWYKCSTIAQTAYTGVPVCGLMVGVPEPSLDMGTEIVRPPTPHFQHHVILNEMCYMHH